MADVFLLTGALAFVVIAALVFFIIRKSEAKEDKGRGRAVQIERADGGARRPVRNRAGVRNRMNRQAEADEAEEIPFEAREQQLHDDTEEPEGKVGTKKLRKLEEKAEKRRMREIELEEREERKKKQAEDDEKRKAEELKEELREKQIEEEERKRKEEQERRDHEEYLKMKATFDVEEEGYDDDDGDDESGKLAEFIRYINDKKVIQLDDLASRFKLKTQDCIDRVKLMLGEETLCGVIDDRGKFISITREELDEVAKFIKLRGRVSIQELVENSNRLISLTPAESVA